MRIGTIGRTLVVAATTAGAALAQDDCATAAVIGLGATPFDNTTATVSPELFPCGGANNNALDLWYTYTPSAAGNIVTIDTIGSTFDTRLQVLDGACGAQLSLACNDDAPGFGLQSRVSFTAPSTNPLYVRVAGFNGAFGAGTLNVAETFPGDECAGALPLAIGANAFNTVGATTSAPAFTCALAGGSDVWFSYVATGIGNTVQVSTCGGTTLDTFIEVYSGTCGTLTSLGCNDDSCGLQSTLSFVTPALGATFFVRLGGFNGQNGTGTITLTDTAPPPTFDLAFTDCLPATYVDISTTGTPLNVGDDGEADITTTVSNALFAAGTVRVGANGGIRFAGTGTQLSLTNAILPSSGAFSTTSQSLLPFWDDMLTNTVPTGTLGNVYWQEISGTLYIQWERTQFFGSTTAGQFVTYQVQVPSSGPALARFLYRDIEQPRASGGSSATIGYQGGGIANNVNYAFNSHFAVRNGTNLSLINRLTASTFMTSALPGTFTDISGTGTPLNLGDDDSTDITTTVGNAMFAAGNVRVGSNGAVRFGGSGQSLGFGNASIPSGSAYGLTSQVAMPFWDDFNTNFGANGQIYWQEIGDTLIIQWNNAAFFNLPAEVATFQVQVFRGGPLVAQYLYQSVQGARANGGASATIGYQSGGVAGNNVQWSLNTAGSVSDGTVLSICYANATVGTRYCIPVANSTGVPANFFGTGTTSLAANNLVLNVIDLPANSFGFFIRGSATANTPMSGGTLGTLCVGGTVFRGVGGSIVNSGATGTVSLPAMLTALPAASGTVSATVGQSLWLQYWYRDFVGGSANANLSNALQVFVTL